jgi:hypothetical protein
MRQEESFQVENKEGKNGQSGNDHVPGCPAAVLGSIADMVAYRPGLLILNSKDNSINNMNDKSCEKHIFKNGNNNILSHYYFSSDGSG